MKTLGMRHLALNVRDPQKSKAFYMELLGMDLEWEPDPDNVYLTSGGRDNLALHKTAEPLQKSGQALDHMGFFVSTPEEVDAWYDRVKEYGAPIAKELKTHRDGARSFYFADPDGNVIQMLFHAPIKK